MEGFSEKMRTLLSKLNKVNIDDALRRGHPFFVNNKRVGIIREDFWSHLKSFSNVFVHIIPSDDSSKAGLKPGIHLHADLQTHQQRTSAVNKALEQLREEDAIKPLGGWRHENYAIRHKLDEEPLLEVERAGSGLFGVVTHGVHINGYLKDDTGQTVLWIGRRSKTKQTFPDMYDNMCAGGLPAGMDTRLCAVKECQEEASVSDHILEGLQPCGTVSYFYEDERGMFPESQAIFDLELPKDFKPVNADGEVGSFQKVTVEQLKDLMMGEKFKPNCVAVCLDFLIRHQLIDADTVDAIGSDFVSQMHVPLYELYTDQCPVLSS